MDVFRFQQRLSLIRPPDLFHPWRSLFFTSLGSFFAYRLHSSTVTSRDRTPWNIAERTGQPEILDIYRHYVKKRMNLPSYITVKE